MHQIEGTSLYYHGKSRNFRLADCAVSQSTQERARSAAVELLSTDVELVEKSDYILSIVPPRDAIQIASRIGAALESAKRRQSTPLYFLDLNAISPLTAKKVIAELPSDRSLLRVIDGGILGGPPKVTDNGDKAQSWYKPAVVVSGPDPLASAPVNGENLAEVLNFKHIHSDLGPASGLKMCFAAMNKGFTAIAIQSFTTAKQLGVLPELQGQLQAFNPIMGNIAERSLTIMPPKAYRWVEEMNQIAETMEQFGGFTSALENGEKASSGGDLFRSVSDTYRFIEKTELGKEKTEDRKLGKSAVEVASICAESLDPAQRTTRS